MDTTKRKGTISVTITYICWGLLTVFWNLLAEVNSAYVLAQRVVWSMIFMFGHLAVTGRMGDIRKIFHDKKTVCWCVLTGAYIFSLSIRDMCWMPAWDIFWSRFLSQPSACFSFMKG